jgi:hypothetical protein
MRQSPRRPGHSGQTPISPGRFLLVTPSLADRNHVVADPRKNEATISLFRRIAHNNARADPPHRTLYLSKEGLRSPADQVRSLQ